MGELDCDLSPTRTHKGRPNQHWGSAGNRGCGCKVTASHFTWRLNEPAGSGHVDASASASLQPSTALQQSSALFFNDLHGMLLPTLHSYSSCLDSSSSSGQLPETRFFEEPRITAGRLPDLPASQS